MTCGEIYEKDGEVVVDESALSEAARTYGDRLRARIAADEAATEEVSEVRKSTVIAEDDSLIIDDSDLRERRKFWSDENRAARRAAKETAPPPTEAVEMWKSSAAAEG